MLQAWRLNAISDCRIFRAMNRFQKGSASQITLLRKLQKRKYRREMNVFVAEGHRTVTQILEYGSLDVQDVFVTEAYLDDFGYNHLPESTYLLTDREMHSVADSETPQGIVAVCTVPPPIELDAILHHPGCILAFDRIQDPGNMGTIIRTAAWFGVDLLMIGEGSVDMWNPKVVRSTAGATGSLAYIECNLAAELEKLSEHGWRPALLDGNPGSQPIEEWDPGMRTVLVVGNEAQGVSPELADLYDRYRIDATSDRAAAESLNASIAAGIALYVLSQKTLNRI